MGGVDNTLGAAWIEFSAMRLGRPNANRWAEVVRKGDQLHVSPPGHKESSLARNGGNRSDAATDP